MTKRIACMLALATLSACANHQPASNTITPAASPPAAGGGSTSSAQKSYTPADVHFVAGMIGHHAQAILMAGWAPWHGASPSVRVLCERIVVGLNADISFAQRWLRWYGG